METLLIEGLRRGFLESPFGVMTLVCLGVATWAIRELLRCKDKDAQRAENLASVIERSNAALMTLTTLMEARTVVLVENTRMGVEHDKRVLEELRRVELLVGELRNHLPDARR